MEAKKQKKTRPAKMEAGRKGVRILLNKKLYDKETIESSIKDFQGVCKGLIKEKDNFFEITLIPNNKEQITNLNLEFSNYVLASMKNRAIV